MLKNILLNARGFCLLLFALITSLYGAWMVNAKLGYGYSWLYELYQTEQHIHYYAPQNRYRSGFETTSIIQHKAVFQQIVDSVHSDGFGLEDIYYEFMGKPIPLLHEAEIIHLQDVANLINIIHYFSWACISLFLLGVLWEYRHRVKGKSRASAKGLFITFLSLTILIMSLFLTVGAKEIFYQLHILIFPADHQWFFYYQDSLMSTLMKAPDLFAGIAVQIAVLGLVFYALLLLAMKRLLERGETAKR